MRSFGRYRLVEPLASGGMADVWRAETTLAEGVVKQVALKLVRGEHGARSDFVRMFVEEARLASRLGHANVVQVLDFDQVDGRYYIAMELVRGHDLGRVVERCRDRGVRLGLARAVHAGAEVAKALAYAHRLADGGAPLGVVHRDVSPHNVLVSYEGEVKLADFGIARAMGQAGLTAPGTLKGKLAYMAPEQARGEPLDARADVFALGVVLWELCAGRRLFARDTDAATLAAVLDGPPPSPPSAWNEEVPPELDAAILGALERDRVRRTGSAQELATALAGVLLRVTRTPDDADLRALMQRLWPVEERVAAARADATRVRPVPGAAEPLEGAVPPAPAETRVAPPPAEEESATRTAARPRAASGRTVRATVIGALLVAIAASVVIWIWREGRGRDRSGTSASTSTSGPPAVHPEPLDEARGRLRAEASAEVRSRGAPIHPQRTPEDLSPVPRDLHVLTTFGTPAPAAATGEGVLAVNALPWGSVSLNGARLGETPLSIRLPSGRYRVVVERPGGADVAKIVSVSAGKRTAVVAR